MKPMYTIKASLGENLWSSCLFEGDNAMHAFEKAVECGALPMPRDDEVDIVVINDAGLGISFTAHLNSC